MDQGNSLSWEGSRKKQHSPRMCFRQGPTVVTKLCPFCFDKTTRFGIFHLNYELRKKKRLPLRRLDVTGDRRPCRRTVLWENESRRGSVDLIRCRTVVGSVVYVFDLRSNSPSGGGGFFSLSTYIISQRNNEGVPFEPSTLSWWLHRDTVTLPDTFFHGVKKDDYVD